jgi:hypothetical protein
MGEPIPGITSTGERLTMSMPTDPGRYVPDELDGSMTASDIRFALSHLTYRSNGFATIRLDRDAARYLVDAAPIATPTRPTRSTGGPKRKGGVRQKLAAGMRSASPQKAPAQGRGQDHDTKYKG